jgi:hypothetical protein
MYNVSFYFWSKFDWHQILSFCTVNN